MHISKFSGPYDEAAATLMPHDDVIYWLYYLCSDVTFWNNHRPTEYIYSKGRVGQEMNCVDWNLHCVFIFYLTTLNGTGLWRSCHYISINKSCQMKLDQAGWNSAGSDCACSFLVHQMAPFHHSGLCFWVFLDVEMNCVFSQRCFLFIANQCQQKQRERKKYFTA